MKNLTFRPPWKTGWTAVPAGIPAGRTEAGATSYHLLDLTPDERAAVEALAHGIAAKLLHDPIVELKERSEPGTEGVHARVLAELLGIDPDAT